MARLGWFAALLIVLGCGEGGTVPGERPDPGGDPGSPDVPAEAPDPSGLEETAADGEAEAAPDATGAEAEDADNGEVADEGPIPGGPEWPCTDNSQCLSGWCVETPDGLACARGCTDVTACAAGFVCAQVATYPDVVYACVHPAPRTCRPCSDSEDCEAAFSGVAMSCASLSGFSFCLRECDPQGACPAGFSCEGADRGGKGGTCVPAGGVCECPNAAVAGGDEGACVIANDHGECAGTFACAADGPGACEGPIPAAEACNGKDDDCDGEADEDWVDATPCDLTNAYGTCPGHRACVAGKPECKGAYALPEVCNGIDDDCDGETDQGSPDIDGDGLADCVDPDRDGDGVEDADDNCEGDPNPGQSDVDADGAGDACDPDDDGDAVIDALDNCVAVPNPAQIDTDHDGAGDACDADADADGVANAEDNCPYVANPGQGDIDLDGVGDACDGDSDGDGVPDGEDNCVAVANPGQDDLEGDGIGDACDPDDDGDGVPDVADLCPAVADPSQSDIDGDGLGDACDADKDGDGVLNGADNCAGTPNPGQEDGNGDGVGDACESDWDGDGVANGDDDCPLDFDPGQEDLDGDGIGDACDPDLDGDGIANGEDGCPAIADPGQEDLDADGIGDVCDGDRDGDGDPNGTDCAPDDSAVRHGAAEACNGGDDDCDGVTDEEDADGCAILYRDADFDGWGWYLARCLCGPAAPYTASVAGDCNDGRTDVNPGATEACGNATDDDCDGLTDEAGGSGCSTWYKDADTDGYGVEADAACLCSPAGGYTAKVVGDCNDLDRTTFPGQAEACNQKDDDCDGTVDEEDASGCADWLLDADRDGFGADGLARCLCKGAAPWDAAKGGDCDDGATAVYPGAAEACNGTDDDCDGEVDEAGATGCTKYWLDADGDGHGVALGSMCLCAPAVPYSAITTGDCNDSASAVHPGAAEACNLVDDDCNGVPDDPGAAGCEDHFFDNDQDGFGVSGNRKCLCAPSGKWSASADGDCNDSDKNVYPGAVEACNGRDDDCDAAADEQDALGCRAFWLDADADGYGVAGASRCLCAGAGQHTADKAGDCDDAATAVNPGAAEACANGRDDDCDEVIDEEGCQGCTTYWLDADADGWGVTGQTKCLSAPSGTWTAGRGGDCDDASAAVSPDAAEACNGKDDDCDGATDEGVKTTFHLDADGDGFGSATVTTQACAQPAGYVAGGTDCNDGNPNVRPGGTEQCNLLDDDCDGEVDEGVKSAFHRDKDGDGFGDPAASVQACAAPAGHVANSGDCDDGRTSVHPGAAEQCNGLDDNCDGGVDEGVKATFWRDADGDGYGNVAATTQACTAPAGYVANAVDCNDAEVAVHPGAAEACNATDDDCDGAVDEGVLTTFFRDLDGDGYGNPAATTQACAATAGWVADSSDCDDVRAAVHPGAAETCNGLDDDCDGGVDEGVLSTFRRDADGDGFGNAAVTTQACSVPVGYVADATDCDDTRASVHPGAAEVCYNTIDDDCNGTVDQPCALRSCAEVHANNPTAPSGSYTLDPDGPGPKTAVAVECDMAFGGGGWTRVGASVRVWGTGWDGTAWNSAGFSYSEVLVRHVSGSVHAHCTYPEGLPGCVPLGFQIPAVQGGWGGPVNWGSSTCGMGVFTWTNTTFFSGTYHFKFGVGTTTSGTIQTGTLEGISNCTTGDNPGEARLDLWVR